MRRWADRSDVDRVDLYTRATLYLMVWLFPLVTLPDFMRTTRDRPELLSAAFAGLVVLATASTVALRAAMELYPRRGPLPLLPITLVVAVAGGACGLARLAPEDPRFAMLLVISVAFAWSLGGFRDNRVAGLGVVLATLAPYVSTFEPRAALVGLVIGLFFVASVRLTLWMLQVIVELEQAKGVQAALAVAEERLRFSRDVHDVLGRRLSTIAVQAELGSALAERGDDRAAEKMLEVRATAHLALREARELARGYRPVDLTQEIEGARSLLRSADISLEVDIGGLPEDWHEPAAWVVRESVTNVLRHSSATAMQVGYADRVLRLRNDGAHAASTTVPAASGGSGLAGLRERLGPLGGSMSTHLNDGWFEIRVQLPTIEEEKP